MKWTSYNEAGRPHPAFQGGPAGAVLTLSQHYGVCLSAQQPTLPNFSPRHRTELHAGLEGGSVLWATFRGQILGQASLACPSSILPSLFYKLNKSTEEGLCQSWHVPVTKEEAVFQSWVEWEVQQVTWKHP